MATRKRITPAHLERSALWHLERRALTVAQLRRILERKLARAEEKPAEAKAWIDEVIAKCGRAGFLDDTRLAAGRVAALHDRGVSARGIAARLRQKGVDQKTAEAALAVISGGDAELEAARAYVRRRRLAHKDRQKALQALARQGFSFAVAKRALDELADPATD